MKSLQLTDRLLGRDLSWAVNVLFFFFLCAQAGLHFHTYSMRPVSGKFSNRFPPDGYQNTDVPEWTVTGIMLPQNAPSVRAMRPLYPGIVTVAAAFNLIEIPAAYKSSEPGIIAKPLQAFDSWRAVRILQVANVMMFLMAIWTFFAMCRHYQLPMLSSVCVSLAAGSGFGFSFLITQAIPEVFGYYTAVVALAILIIAHEHKLANSMAGSYGRKEVMVWAAVGLLFGILLLGKELYYLPIFAGLILLWKRVWIGLVAFLIMVLLPTMLWNYYMAEIVKAYNPAEYLRKYRFLIWLWEDLAILPLDLQIRTLAYNLWMQVSALFKAFAFIPLLLAAFGWRRAARAIGHPGLIPLYFLSFYLLFLISNFVMPRLLFMTWPVVYFMAWNGLRCISESITTALKLTGDKQRLTVLWIEIAALVFFVWMGTINLYRFYDYG